MIFVVENEVGERVSPLVNLNLSGDISFYKKFSGSPFEPFFNLVSVNNFSEYLSWANEGHYPGPIFPLLVELTNYVEGSPIWLALLYLFIANLTVITWIIYFKDRNATYLEFILIIIYPVGVYYSLFISTDMLFAFIFSILFVLLSTFQKASFFKILAILVLALVLIGLRPNSVVILPMIVLFIWKANNGLSYYSLLISFFGVCVLAVIAIAYYYPYFLAFKNASETISYWGIVESAYIEGVFSNFNQFINLFMSWSALLLSKIVYLCGLRPSYSDTAIHFVAIRALGSIFLIPGFFYLFIKGTRFEKLSALIFFTPIFLGASQERYLLPLYPVLMFYGSQFWKNLFEKLKTN